MARLLSVFALICICVLSQSACSGGSSAEAQCTGSTCDQPPVPDGSPLDGGIPPDATPPAFCASLGAFPDHWISGGPDCGTEEDIQVHQLNADTFILRQSLCTSAEAPFLYLLFGDDKALLEDTGDGGIDLVSVVNGLVADREAAIGHGLELIVVNSHAHGDHVGANRNFVQDGATVVGPSQQALMNFFAMGWPRQLASYDLGGRIIDLAGIPGHQDDHIVIYDRNYGMLLTGDTVYPGRLFINNFSEYKQSVSFLVDFAGSNEVCAVLGTHIELTNTPGDDYNFGVDFHPNERPLPLAPSVLNELKAAVDAMGNSPIRETHDDFIVFPL